MDEKIVTIKSGINSEGEQIYEDIRVVNSIPDNYYKAVKTKIEGKPCWLLRKNTSRFIKDKSIKESLKIIWE